MASSLQQRVESQPVLFSRVWQQPYVNVFKQMGIFDGHHAKLQGDVKVILDPTLNKQVLCIKGSVSAANFIELPGPGTTHRERTRNPAAARVTSLGLTGEYMYLQIRAMTDRFFAIHIDVLTTQGLTIRLSISNIFKYIKLMNHGRVLQLPCDFLSTKWTVLALHFPSLLEECSNNVQSMNAFAENNQLDPSVVTAAGTNGAIKYSYANIQRVQFCSNLYVKNMITSNHKYSISTFPKEVKFFVGKNYTFDDFYEFFWIITPPSKAQQLEAAAKREESLLVDVEEARAEAQALLNSQGDSKPIEDVRSQSLAPLDASQRLFEQAKNKHGQISPAKHSVPVSVAPFANQTISPHKPITPAAPNPHSIAAASFERVVGSELTAEEQASRARFQPLTTAEFDEDPEENKRDEAAPLGSEETEFSQSSRIKSQLANSHYTAQDSVEQEEEFDPRFNDTTLVPDPILGLEKIIGYSASRTSKNLVWSPDGQYMIYPSNNILIISHVKTGQQEFLTGHTACINVVAMSSNGILATGQEGKQPLIRLWDFQKRTCVGILMAHNSDLRCLAFSYLNLMLGAVGRDAQGRILIVIWDISSLLENGKIHIVAKQLSDFGINRLLFSPFREDPMHLISCGHESIRFWRIKTKHLPGSSLQLNEHARNTFTDIAFESKYGDADQTTKRMFVSTASGSLFQINYATRQLECIYKLHSGPIYSISINEGFCVTGSGDSFLRVWPLDFSDYFLQAQHKGAITSVQISTDGLHVLVGSENGCIGVLDLGSTAYQTRIRSHLDTIYQVAFDPHRDEFCTVSKDGTIRIFGTYSLEQIYEFYSPHEIIHCVAYHPLASEYRIACGFASGSMRIMDIATTTMHVDYQQHTGRILDVVFSHDGLFLYSNGEDGNICAYDCSKQYLPVRMFTTYRHQPVPLPPSVSRTLAAEAERSAAIGKSAERIKTEHEGRSPFLSHHLDRARQEEKESQLAPGVRLPHHSHSHARHCDPNGHIGASIAPAGPHSHGSQREAGPKPLPPHALAINDDGSLLATIGADPTSIVILSTDTLRQIRLLSTCAAPVARLHFAQASRELAVVLTDASFMRFNVDSGSLITHVQPSPSMRFKQERALAGKQTLDSLAFAAAASGVPSLNGGVTATSSTISPLNLYLLTGSNEGLLRVWDFHSKTHAPHFQSFTAHQNPYVPQEGITSIMFSPDGKRLITTGGDSIWIWNVKADEKQALNDLKRRNHRRAIEQTRVPHSHHSIVPHSALALSFGQRVQPTMMQQLDPTVSSAGSSFRHAPSAPAVDHHPQQQPRGSSMHEVAVESHQPAYNPSVYETGSSSSTTAAVAPSSVPRSAWAENPSGSNAAAPRL